MESIDGETVYVVTIASGAYSNYDNRVHGLYATLDEAQGQVHLDWVGPTMTEWGKPVQRTWSADATKPEDHWNMDPETWTITEWVVGQTVRFS